ncbi:RecD-like DNA helicase YrrC [Leuconostoc pseudomesenteroides 4882]|nr:RecD-like DNA helicase YrrC [Leuconostoc pseudomesenteroides 4882]
MLQLENDSERDVYNGDMGKIIAVQYKKILAMMIMKIA